LRTGVGLGRPLKLETAVIALECIHGWTGEPARCFYLCGRRGQSHFCTKIGTAPAGSISRRRWPWYRRGRCREARSSRGPR
jgi:hypothetical protein